MSPASLVAWQAPSRSTSRRAAAQHPMSQCRSCKPYCGSKAARALVHPLCLHPSPAVAGCFTAVKRQWILPPATQHQRWPLPALSSHPRRLNNRLTRRHDGAEHYPPWFLASMPVGRQHNPCVSKQLEQKRQPVSTAIRHVIPWHRPPPREGWQRSCFHHC